MSTKAYKLLKDKDVKLPKPVAAFQYFQREGLDYVRVHPKKGKSKEYLMPNNQKAEKIFMDQLEAAL